MPLDKSSPTILPIWRSLPNLRARSTISPSSRSRWKAGVRSAQSLRHQASKALNRPWRKAANLALYTALPLSPPRRGTRNSSCGKISHHLSPRSYDLASEL